MLRSQARCKKTGLAWLTVVPRRCGHFLLLLVAVVSQKGRKLEDEWTSLSQTFPPVSSGVESRKESSLQSGCFKPGLSEPGGHGPEAVPRAGSLSGEATEPGEPGVIAWGRGRRTDDGHTRWHRARGPARRCRGSLGPREPSAKPGRGRPASPTLRPRLLGRP